MYISCSHFLQREPFPSILKQFSGHLKINLYKYHTFWSQLKNSSCTVVRKITSGKRNDWVGLFFWFVIFVSILSLLFIFLWYAMVRLVNTLNFLSLRLQTDQDITYGNNNEYLYSTWSFFFRSTNLKIVADIMDKVNGRKWTGNTQA